MSDKEQKSILTQLQEVAEEICDRYCKFPEQYAGEDQETPYEKICDGGPLERLL